MLILFFEICQIVKQNVINYSLLVTNSCMLSWQLYITINRALVTACLQNFYFSQILSICSDPNTCCLQLLWRTTYSYLWDGYWTWNTGSTKSYRSCREGMLVLNSHFLIGFVEIWCQWLVFDTILLFFSPLFPLCKYSLFSCI